MGGSEGVREGGREGGCVCVCVCVSGSKYYKYNLYMYMYMYLTGFFYSTTPVVKSGHSPHFYSP